MPINVRIGSRLRRLLILGLVASCQEVVPLDPAEEMRTLSIHLSGTGLGSIKAGIAAENGSTCAVAAGSSCELRYPAGTGSVGLTATPDTKSSFAGWGGSCSGTGSCAVNMSSSRDVSAEFKAIPDSATLAIDFLGTGGGTVTTSRPGSNGSTCTTPSSTPCRIRYEVGSTALTLTATAASGSTFAGWGGACSGSSTCSMTMTEGRTVTARFDAAVTSSTNPLTDSFDAGLANWTTVSGTWTTSSGTLIGEYDISCGSSGCDQGDLLLKDALQPTGDWKVEAQMSSVRYPYSAGYDLTYALATFSVYATANDRLAFSAGWGINNAPMPQTLDSLQVYISRGMPWQALSVSATKPVAVWAPSQWNTVALEKLGTTYRLYFNGALMQTVTATLAVTPKVGFHVYGKMLVDNFKLTRY